MTPSTASFPVKTAESDEAKQTAPAPLGRILVAIDASDHANRALAETVRLAKSADGEITGIHAYAAMLHDRRFKMMEGGLPDRYLDEKEMTYQRDVHDDLITRGLDIISESYHDAGAEACQGADIPFHRLSPEGKNYRKVVEAARSGNFDVLALGAFGLGAVPGSLIGTVCERVVRRSPIDTFVVRDKDLAIGDGPIVAAIDGSPYSYGALMTALDIAQRLGTEVHAVAAYDPYYHYVAFNKIAGVLSEEAGKVFRFKEQEKLHEELIDDGIAKIYQSHLDVAATVAEDLGATLPTKLLDGKPFTAIRQYLEEVKASLVVLGRTGVHADDDLDIGGNAENLLRTAPCHVWLTVSEYTPPLDVIAEETIAWSMEAEKRISKAPEFVRDMARRMVLRHAQKQGHTYITSDLVDEVMSKAMPGYRGDAAEDRLELEWSPDALELLETVADEAVADNIRLRAVKRARRDKSSTVQPSHVRVFLEIAVEEGPTWSAAALARLAKVPEMIREIVRNGVEDLALDRGLGKVSLDLAEEGIAEARKAMCPVPHDETANGGPAEQSAPEAETIEWTAEAEARLARVPEGFIRDMTRQRVEVFAKHHGVKSITLEVIEEKYAEWGAGSAKQGRNLEWADSAAGRIERIPDFVRGMVIVEIERCAREMGLDRVTDQVIDNASGAWEKLGAFHSEGKKDLYKE